MQWLSSAINITPSGTTGWQTVDLSTHGVPANAVCLLRGTYNAEIGARKTGSTDNRTYSNPTRNFPIYCGVDANSKIDLYKSNTLPVYYLQGWFTASEASYFDAGINKTPPSSTDWQDIDCSANIPSGANFAIFEVNINDTYVDINFRKKGSSDDRKNSRNIGHWWAVVPLDSNRVCQIYYPSTSTNTIYLVGYIINGVTKNAGLDISLTTTGSYVSQDLTSDAPPSATAVLIETQYVDPNTGGYYGLRKSGDTDDFYNMIGTPLASIFNVIALDSTSKKIEQKINDTRVDSWVLGYTGGAPETTATGSGIFPVLIGNGGGYWATAGDGIFPALQSNADLVSFENAGVATFPIVTGTGELAPQLGGFGDFPLILSDGMVLVGEVMTGNSLLPVFRETAELAIFNVYFGTVNLPALQGTGIHPAGEILSGISIFPPLTGFGNSIIYGVTTSVGIVTLPMLMGEGYANLIAKEHYQVYVMNLRNFGLSQYSNFNYNSICKFQGKYYGLNSEGLYLLEGDSDDGSPIAAIVETGRDDFGLRTLKRIADVFVTMKANGEYLLTLVNKDGTEYSYPIVSRTSTLETYKRDIGKGTRSQLWGLKFKNINGAKFEIESIELNVEEITKRRYGQ